MRVVYFVAFTFEDPSLYHHFSFSLPQYFEWISSGKDKVKFSEKSTLISTVERVSKTLGILIRNWAAYYNIAMIILNEI